METRIRALFADVLRVPTAGITDETTPERIENWDSFNQMVLISAFEEEFNISIEPEEVFEMYRDYKTFKSVIVNKLGLKGPWKGAQSGASIA